MTVRLFGLIARDGPRAVIFRRGPSKRVHLVSWNTDTDAIEPGQTFHGRVYERYDRIRSPRTSSWR
ncbi:MAG: hypothetical protein JOZ54_14135 [Acidobacteria bacterium]|nr:hypothetical protein [Acidobacteriota bacterium]